MMLHRNAKLGLAGRHALVQAIEEGMKAAAAAFSVSPATAHRWWHRCVRRASRRGPTSPALSIARAARAALRAGSAPSSRSASAPVGANGLGPAACCRRDRLRALDRLEGAPSASRVQRGRLGSLPTATSGPARATSCTWTSAATPASSIVAMRCR
jgi:hypothetical protein